MNVGQRGFERAHEAASTNPGDRERIGRAGTERIAFITTEQAVVKAGRWAFPHRKTYQPSPP